MPEIPHVPWGVVMPTHSLVTPSSSGAEGLDKKGEG